MTVGVLALALLIHGSCGPLPVVAPLECELQSLLASDPTKRPRVYVDRLHDLKRRYVLLQASSDQDLARHALVGESRLLMQLAQLQTRARLPKRLTADQQAVYLLELHRIAASNLQLAVIKLNRAAELSRVHELTGPCTQVFDSVARNAREQLDSITQRMAELGD